MRITSRVGTWMGRSGGSYLAYAFAALLLIAPGAALGQRVELVSGSVEIGTGEPPVWKQAHEGQALYPGDVVRTGHDGRVELALPAGTVRLYEDSLLRLPNEWEQDGRTETVELNRGSSIFDIFKRDPGSRFGVETPEAVVMVKGTQFSVALDDSGTAVAVFEGTVGVSAPDSGEELLVHEGFAAVGGADHPFELALTFPDSDPFETWDQGGEAPALPTEVMEEMPTSEFDSARAATFAAVEEDLNLAPAFDASIVPDGAAPDATAGSVSEQDATTDPVADATQGVQDEFHEEFLEETLGGTLSGFDLDVIKSGGPNYVQITGLPSGTVNLDDSALMMIVGGNLSPLGSDLPTILNNAGIDPVMWAMELGQLL